MCNRTCGPFLILGSGGGWRLPRRDTHNGIHNFLLRGRCAVYPATAVVICSILSFQWVDTHCDARTPNTQTPTVMHARTHRHPLWCTHAEHTDTHCDARTNTQTPTVTHARTHRHPLWRTTLMMIFTERAFVISVWMSVHTHGGTWVYNLILRI